MNSYPVIVFNPNLNEVDGNVIPFNQSMGDHSLFVWKHYVEPSNFNSLLIIAHSAGGSCISAIQTGFANTFYKKVKQIAFTDSYIIDERKLNKEQK